MEQRCSQAFRFWKSDPFFDPQTRQELIALTDPEEIEDRFYKDLQFGTGGLRGILGAGTNRMNQYTVRRATTGFGAFLLETYGAAAMTRGVAIAYDCRDYSREFAKAAALTLAAQGIRAYVFDQISATPLLSFAVRHLGCAGGIVITASHNPPAYNGYKAYDQTGCQLSLQDSQGVTARISGIDIRETSMMAEAAAREQGLFCDIGEDLLSAFLDAVEVQAHPLDPRAKQALGVVYSPLHGTGAAPVCQVLARQGYTGLETVAAQMTPDGKFSTLRSPNPEERDALSMAIAQAEAGGADLVLGTDPDCDRVGIAVRDSGGYTLLSGNQTGALLLYYVLSRRRDRLTPASTLIKTIVTSEFGTQIAKSFGLQVVETLTGFKFIGALMNGFDRDPAHAFVMGYEESYGYLVGDHVRDKDAVTASLLLCEMTAYYKAQGKTLADILAQLYAQYGCYLDVQDSFTFPGKEGAARIAELCGILRQQGAGFFPDTEEFLDYQRGIGDIPPSDVLKYVFPCGSWLAVRPSGTEPKVKVYYSIHAPDPQAARQQLEIYQERIQLLIKN